MERYLRKDQRIIATVNLLVIGGYTIFFLTRLDFEFLLYVGIIILIFGLLLISNKKVGYSNLTLWGMTIWGILHMSGGGIPVGDDVLYSKILIPLSTSYEILKYDQVVHIFGFATATLLMYELMRPLMHKEALGTKRLSFILVMSGAGLGSLNEIFEFIATVLVPENGVGGYVNTSLDLIANLIGALIALFIIRYRAKKVS
ncbi:hypothetical protein COV82_00220 [Candidatus Peregrinibacteria bacterium CG11_big_fil_rev_8_21_14_0_20_46_8]|nr:MAG: hypothetical protein COV82_00220 [Candidatus Peregrinibacteria bacterium CG11_big_fil_rev_8_21_14_0_20_46_8]